MRRTKRELERRIDALADEADDVDVVETPPLTPDEKDALDAAFDPARETPDGIGEWLTDTYGLTPVDEVVS
ncbi:hypothetical protein [Halopelagius fulvigenes]|uniref:Uncharacterized protein n=1 Tax=Halopelagius fulvigenes TaxID=1198324 RepID=A0ABD5TST2_9EURY